MTVHPSYLLRLPDPEAKVLEYQRFVEDLKIAAALQRKARARRLKQVADRTATSRGELTSFQLPVRHFNRLSHAARKIGALGQENFR